MAQVNTHTYVFNAITYSEIVALANAGAQCRSTEVAGFPRLQERRNFAAVRLRRPDAQTLTAERRITRKRESSH